MTDRGTCLIHYIGSVPRGITALSHLVRAPEGTLSANFTVFPALFTGSQLPWIVQRLDKPTTRAGSH